MLYSDIKGRVIKDGVEEIFNPDKLEDEDIVGVAEGVDEDSLVTGTVAGFLQLDGLGEVAEVLALELLLLVGACIWRDGVEL